MLRFRQNSSQRDNEKQKGHSKVNASSSSCKRKGIPANAPVVALGKTRFRDRMGEATTHPFKISKLAYESWHGQPSVYLLEVAMRNAHSQIRGVPEGSRSVAEHAEIP